MSTRSQCSLICLALETGRKIASSRETTRGSSFQRRGACKLATSSRTKATSVSSTIPPKNRNELSIIKIRRTTAKTTTWCSTHSTLRRKLTLFARNTTRSRKTSLARSASRSTKPKDEQFGKKKNLLTQHASPIRLFKAYKDRPTRRRDFGDLFKSLLIYISKASFGRRPGLQVYIRGCHF